MGVCLSTQYPGTAAACGAQDSVPTSSSGEQLSAAAPDALPLLSKAEKPSGESADETATAKASLTPTPGLEISNPTAPHSVGDAGTASSTSAGVSASTALSAAPLAGSYSYADEVHRAAVRLVLGGGAYQSNVSGPPRPPCQAQRCRTVQAIQATLPRARRDPAINELVELAQSLFRADCVVLTLYTHHSSPVVACGGSRKSMAGFGVPWTKAVGPFSLGSDYPQALLIPDMRYDARSNHQSTERMERFYCGVPLVAADGHRLGSLAVAGEQLRQLEGRMVNVLVGLTEMVTRILEEEWVAHQRKLSKAQLPAVEILRGADAYGKQLLLVDCGPGGDWRVLFANSAAAKQAGIVTSQQLPTSFWDTCQPMPPSQAGWEPFVAAVRRMEQFVVEGYLPGSCSTGRILCTLRFRLAAKDALDENAALVGVPPELPMVDPAEMQNADSGRGRVAAAAARLFFVEVAPQPAGGSQVIPPGAPLSLYPESWEPPLAPPAELEGLELGPLLGVGRTGRVYRGWYKGVPVAVKILGVAPESGGRSSGTPFVCSTLVGTLACAVGGIGPGGAPAEWWVLEFCNAGCLQGAIERGLFQALGNRQDSEPDMKLVSEVAFDISRALVTLHSQGLLHGDLSSSKVLLLKSTDLERGTSTLGAKVSVPSGEREQPPLLWGRRPGQGSQYCSIAHLAPERLTGGAISHAADVYSFGVIMWELVSGTRAWAGLTDEQLQNVVSSGQVLAFPRCNALPAQITYFELAEACMSVAPEARPSFQQAAIVLKASVKAWPQLGKRSAGWYAVAPAEGGGGVTLQNPEDTPFPVISSV